MTQIYNNYFIEKRIYRKIFILRVGIRRKDWHVSLTAIESREGVICWDIWAESVGCLRGKLYFCSQ